MLKSNKGREKLLEKLKELGGKGSDPEICHSLADKALLEYIDDPEIKELFDNIEKWYA